jgi:hypothetical protein
MKALKKIFLKCLEKNAKKILITQTILKIFYTKINI